MLTADSDISSPGMPPSPAHTRSHGKAKKTKDSEPIYKGDGVVYLPGDINGLSKKLHLLAKHLQEPQLKKAFEDTCGIDINALIGGSGIGLKR